MVSSKGDDQDGICARKRQKVDGGGEGGARDDGDGVAGRLRDRLLDCLGMMFVVENERAAMDIEARTMVMRRRRWDSGWYGRWGDGCRRRLRGTIPYLCVRSTRKKNQQSTIHFRT